MAPGVMASHLLALVWSMYPALPVHTGIKVESWLHVNSYLFTPVPDFIMWASCCNWFCLDGQPEEAPPPQGARTQAYSNPGYSSFPSPTGSEPSCKACGVHFASTTRKVSAIAP